MRGVDVVLALQITRDRCDLFCLNDQILLKARDRLTGLLRSALVGVADRNQCCHQSSFLVVDVGPASASGPARSSPKRYERRIALGVLGDPSSLVGTISHRPMGGRPRNAIPAVLSRR